MGLKQRLQKTFLPVSLAAAEAATLFTGGIPARAATPAEEQTQGVVGKFAPNAGPTPPIKPTVGTSVQPNTGSVATFQMENKTIGTAALRALKESFIEYDRALLLGAAMSSHLFDKNMMMQIVDATKDNPRSIEKSKNASYFSILTDKENEERVVALARKFAADTGENVSVIVGQTLDNRNLILFCNGRVALFDSTEPGYLLKVRKAMDLNLEVKNTHERKITLSASGPG